MVQIMKFTPEEKEFFDMISEEHDVTINPSVTSPNGIQTVMIHMRRCFNDDHVSLYRMAFNYFKHHEIIPKQLPIKKHYDNICNEMFEELKTLANERHEMIGGIIECHH